MLEQIREQVDWDVFVPRLDEIFGQPGCKNYIFSDPKDRDTMVMYRAILLKVMCSLSIDELYIFLLGDTSSQRFAGFEGRKDVPDEETLSLFSGRLEQSGRADELFELFKNQLLECGYQFNEGRQLPYYRLGSIKVLVKVRKQ